MTVQAELADKVAALCAAHGVKRLELFGSAARGDFDVHSSDVDFLVDFSDPNYVGAFDRYFGFKEALEKLLQRPVDLVETRAIRNPYFRQAIEGDRMVLYGADR